MAKRYDIKITLISQKKKCHAGHKVGDRFFVGQKTPGGMCMGAFGALFPYLTTLRFGGSFPWEKKKGEGTFCCPDPDVLNVFHVERIEPLTSKKASD